MAFLDQILAWLQTGIGMSITLGTVLELILRVFPSEKPLSIAYLVAGVFHKLGAVLESAAVLMDKVLPQRLK